APDQPGCFQSLEQRSERARLQRKLVSDTADRLLVLAPQYVEHKVLWVCQTQLVEQRLVRALDRHAGGVDRVAKLVLQRDRNGGRFGHGLPFASTGSRFVGKFHIAIKFNWTTGNLRILIVITLVAILRNRCAKVRRCRSNNLQLKGYRNDKQATRRRSRGLRPPCPRQPGAAQGASKTRLRFRCLRRRRCRIGDCPPSR